MLCSFVGKTIKKTLLEGGKKSLYLPGGADYASKSNIGLQRVQAEKLRHDQEQKE